MPIYKSMENARLVFGKRKIKEMAGRYLAGALNKDDVVQFEIFAEGDGYSSGSQFASLIMDAKNFDLEVNNRLKAYMQQFSPLKDKAQIKDDALQALHSDKQMELMALEREILNRMASYEAKTVNEKLRGRVVDRMISARDREGIILD